jgi:hypothetical protein
MNAPVVYASALHCGDVITIATHGGKATVRRITTEAHGKRADLEVADCPGKIFPVLYQDTELVERVREAEWAA